MGMYATKVARGRMPEVDMLPEDGHGQKKEERAGLVSN